MNQMLLLAAAAALALPVTAASAGQTGGGQSMAAQQNADAMAQYDRDMAAYRASLHDNHRAARQDQRHFQHQQRAYADAMAAWRHQTYACHHGSHRACNAPTPNPADYY